MYDTFGALPAPLQWNNRCIRSETMSQRKGSWRLLKLCLRAYEEGMDGGAKISSYPPSPRKESHGYYYEGIPDSIQTRQNVDRVALRRRQNGSWCIHPNVMIRASIKFLTGLRRLGAWPWDFSHSLGFQASHAGVLVAVKLLLISMCYPQLIFAPEPKSDAKHGCYGTAHLLITASIELRAISV